MLNFSLTRRYIPAISLIAIFVIFSHILINKVVNNNKELAKIINISGKQRMLSQKLIILAQNYYEDFTQKQPLIDALNEIKQSHKYLISLHLTPEIDDFYNNKDHGLNKNLKKYLQHFDNLLILYNPMFIKQARQDSLDILKQLDKVVKMYEKYSDKRLQITSEYEYYLMIGTLILLFLEVIFIFRPAAKQIEKNTKQLITNQEYEETVIESNNNAIIAIDWTGKITTYNQKAVEIFGWTKEEMLNTRNLTRIIPPKYKEDHIKASTQYLKTGQSCGAIGKTLELEGLKKDGTIFPIMITFGSKYKVNNAIVVANISDITHEKEQATLMAQQSKMAAMGEMIGNIAHQWRQPLSIISTLATGSKIQKELNMLKDEQFYKNMDAIDKNAQYLSKTIDDFRDFIKGEDKKELFNSTILYEKILTIIEASLKDNFINLIFEDNYKGDIYGSLNILIQAITNIINNAKDILKETDHENKIILFKISKEDSNIVITITDNGGGVPDHIQPKIFDAYFTTKHKSNGTGLGLNMAYNIITNSYNGILKVTNTHFEYDNTKYYGAKFTIVFPLITQ